MSDQLALTEEDLERIRSLHVEWTAKDGRGNPNGPTCSMCLNRWPCPMVSVLTTLDAERALRQAVEAALAELQASYDQATVTRREQNYLIDKLDRSLTEETERAEAAESGLVRLNAALTEMTERAERAESVLADQAQQMREDITRRHAVERRLDEERQARAEDQAKHREHINRVAEEVADARDRYLAQLEGERDQARAALAACEARLAEAQGRVKSLELLFRLTNESITKALTNAMAIAQPAPPPVEETR